MQNGPVERSGNAPEGRFPASLILNVFHMSGSENPEPLFDRKWPKSGADEKQSKSLKTKVAGKRPSRAFPDLLTGPFCMVFRVDSESGHDRISIFGRNSGFSAESGADEADWDTEFPESAIYQYALCPMRGRTTCRPTHT